MYLIREKPEKKGRGGFLWNKGSLGATQLIEYHGKKKNMGGGVSKKVRPALGAYPLSSILGKF